MQLVLLQAIFVFPLQVMQEAAAGYYSGLQVSNAIGLKAV